MLTLKDVVDTCSQIGQITLETDNSTRLPTYKDADALRLTSCCKSVLTELYAQFTPSVAVEMPAELADEVVLPYKQKNGEKTPLLTAETLCHGVLAEYFFQMQDYTCFKVWNERFENAITNLRLSKPRKRMPKRGWI